MGKRTFRLRERRFLAEGPQAVAEALALEGVVQELYVTRAAAGRDRRMMAAASEAGIPVYPVSGQVFDALAQTVSPQGILAVCGLVDVGFDTIAWESVRLVVLLAQVRDPGNAGTVIRCADAAGADAVVLTDSSVDVYNPKCVRASAGSLFHLPVAVGVPVATATVTLRQAGIRVLAADAGGSVDVMSDAAALAAPTAWLFGNEATGLPDAVRNLADAVCRVPIYGRAESLNLATAAAVCLYASATAQHSRDTAGE